MQSLHLLLHGWIVIEILEDDILVTGNLRRLGSHPPELILWYEQATGFDGKA